MAIQAPILSAMAALPGDAAQQNRLFIMPCMESASVKAQLQLASSFGWNYEMPASPEFYLKNIAKASKAGGVHPERACCRNCQKSVISMSYLSFTVQTEFNLRQISHMYRKNPNVYLFLIVPLFALLTACNDPSDAQADQGTDSSKPVMRCAP